MPFNSFYFLAFFFIVTVLYFALPHKYRWQFLLAGSCYFYMAFNPIYILLLGFLIIITYASGLLMETAEERKRRTVFWAGLFSNLGVLFFFKYYNFLIENITSLLGLYAVKNPVPFINIIMPIGLSFQTFQAISYLIEVYYGQQIAEKHFGFFSLYVMFFPKLVTGPIERPQNLLHQFREKYDFDYDRVTSGLRLMAWGLFKKIVIADRLAIPVDNVYNNPQAFNSLSLIIATVFFTIQLYCDFSGYSDIAIGTARILGFRLTLNFKQPYFSKSIAEFWRRWHISLSSWLLDYIFKPLQMNLRYAKSLGNVLAIFITFLISGVWHGANWTFIIWGGIHGFYLGFAMLTADFRKKTRERLHLDHLPILSISSTFFLVTFAWIFFKAKDLHTGVYVAQHIFTGIPDLLAGIFSHRFVFDYLNTSEHGLFLSVGLIFLLATVEYFQSKIALTEQFIRLPWYLRWTAYYGVVLSILFLGVFENHQFIYWKF